MLATRMPLTIQNSTHLPSGRAGDSPRLFHRWVSLPTRCPTDSCEPVTRSGLGG